MGMVIPLEGHLQIYRGEERRGEEKEREREEKRERGEESKRRRERTTYLTS